MNSDTNKADQLQKQQAPLKNTDNAFVEVAKDGEPKIPNEAEENTAVKNIKGRVDNTKNPKFEKEENNSADISKVDQQEGSMHNGELGGNLTKE